MRYEFEIDSITTARNIIAFDNEAITFPAMNSVSYAIFSFAKCNQTERATKSCHRSASRSGP